MLSSHSAFQVLVGLIKVTSVSIFSSLAIIDEVDHAFVESSFIIGWETVMAEISVNAIFIPQFSVVERVVGVSESTFTSVQFQPLVISTFASSGDQQ